MYLKCTSRLVPTFKKIYKDKFNFEVDRAIIFELKDRIPGAELKHCIAMALTYHKIKHLPLLGHQIKFPTVPNSLKLDKNTAAR